MSSYKKSGESRKTYRGNIVLLDKRKNPILRWLMGDSLIAKITGGILFFIIMAVLFNTWVFIAEWLGIPWNAQGY